VAAVEDRQLAEREGGCSVDCARRVEAGNGNGCKEGGC
jgi:hypothetical protein